MASSNVTEPGVREMISYNVSGGVHTQEGGGQQGGQQHKIKDRDNMNILLGVPLEMA